MIPWIAHLYVDGHAGRWYVCYGEWERKFAGPYKREQDAKGQLTRIKKDAKK